MFDSKNYTKVTSIVEDYVTQRKDEWEGCDVAFT